MEGVEVALAANGVDKLIVVSGRGLIRDDKRIGVRVGGAERTGGGDGRFEITGIRSEHTSGAH